MSPDEKFYTFGCFSRGKNIRRKAGKKSGVRRFICPFLKYFRSGTPDKT